MKHVMEHLMKHVMKHASSTTRGEGSVMRLGIVLALLGAVACSSDDGGKESSGTAGASAGASGSGAGASGNGAGASGNGAAGTSTSAGTGASGSSAGASGSGAGTSAAGTSGAVDPPLTTDCMESPWDEASFAQVLDVGPEHALKTPSDVPWETLGAGTLVRIHARAEPYRDKWVLNVAGSEEAPFVVRGVPSAAGGLPVISGEDAVTRTQLDFWGEERSVIKIGGSNVPDNAGRPSHIFVECLDIARAHADYTFTNTEGASESYTNNAAAITVELGDHITLRNNVFRESGNGLFVAAQTSDLRVLGNRIFGNGNVDSLYEHNSYTEALGILFEGNEYGPLCDGCLGNNLKDRSAGTVIRYNWISGGNRQLDLVDSDHIGLYDHPSYRATFVYGNVLVEPDGAGNSQIVHYGGDSSIEERYRKGVLHFFHNTVVSTRAGNTTLARLSSNDEKLDARNNVIAVSSAGESLAIVDGSGHAELRANWLPSGYRSTHGTLSGSVMDLGGNVTGDEPGFVDAGAEDFTLSDDSPCLGVAGPLAAAAAEHPVSSQIARPTVLTARPLSALQDLGALER